MTMASCQWKSVLSKDNNQNNIIKNVKKDENLLLELNDTNQINNNNNQIVLDKICVHIILNSNASRIFKKTLENLINPKNINKNLIECDFLIKISDLIFNNNKIGDMSGTISQEMLRINLSYSIFKINKKEIQQLIAILNKPTAVSLKQLSNQFGGLLSASNGGIMNKEINNTDKIMTAFQTDIIKIKENNIEIDSQFIMDQVYLQNNPYLMNANVQNKSDNIQFLSENLARKVFYNIINFKFSESFKE